MNERFFLDHGAIHDRKTGQHVGMEAEHNCQERLFKLLCGMDAELRALLAERDALREALIACVSYLKDDSGGYEIYKATLEHAESILNATLSEGERG